MNDYDCPLLSIMKIKVKQYLLGIISSAPGFFANVICYMSTFVNKQMSLVLLAHTGGFTVGIFLQGGPLIAIRW